MGGAAAGTLLANVGVGGGSARVDANGCCEAVVVVSVSGDVGDVICKGWRDGGAAVFIGGNGVKLRGESKFAGNFGTFGEKTSCERCW